MSNKFSHLNESGEAKMVDVGAKDVQKRTAIASGFIHLDSRTIDLLKQAALPKGDVLIVAKIAGIQAAKETSRAIPLCHPLSLNYIDLRFQVLENGIRVESEVRCSGKTGVEMEALHAVSVATLTIFDMCKAVDKTMVIKDIQVESKIKE